MGLEFKIRPLGVWGTLPAPTAPTAPSRHPRHPRHPPGTQCSPRKSTDGSVSGLQPIRQWFCIVFGACCLSSLARCILARQDGFPSRGLPLFPLWEQGILPFQRRPLRGPGSVLKLPLSQYQIACLASLSPHLLWLSFVRLCVSACQMHLGSPRWVPFPRLAFHCLAFLCSSAFLCSCSLACWLACLLACLLACSLALLARLLDCLLACFACSLARLLDCSLACLPSAARLPLFVCLPLFAC